jgi:hypothetical protein
MRRLLSFLLVILMSIMPLLSVACVPSGYENENPNRPPNQPSPSAEELQGEGAPESPADEGAGGGDEGATDTGGEDTGE